MRKQFFNLTAALCLGFVLMVGTASAAGYAIENVVKQDGTVSASITCGTEPVKAICAVYDDAGKMIASRTQTVSKTDTYEFTFPDGGFSDAKVFLLDRNSAPLCESWSLSDGGDPVSKELTSEEIYKQCSPAVFYIELFDANGISYGSASGFFVDESGIAVTNYHVIDGAIYAKATLTDKTVHYISGVLYANKEKDYAVIKVEGSDFTALPIGDSNEVVGGQRIYTIGSPKGLQNTISDGIVSNPCREDFYDRIQISAPISPGSSGGALIDTYGRAIGITSGTLNVSGNNLNYAVPINQVFEPGEDPSGLEEQYSLMSLQEMNELVAKMYHQEAFSALKNDILTNSTHTYGNNNDKAVLYSRDDENAAIIYFEDINCITLNYWKDNWGPSLYLNIYEDSTDVFVEYYYYMGETLASYGESTYDASLFYNGMNVTFDNYYGSTGAKEMDENLALMYIDGALSALQHIMLNDIEPTGTYTIADLGFTSYSFE